MKKTTPTALVTSGPTYEPIDPVRFLGNRSSGKQGHAIAAALRDAGFAVTLMSGPTALADVTGVKMVHVTTAKEMLEACKAVLPVDVAVFAAAVADWRPKRVQSHKIKKNGSAPPVIELVENPDILKTVATHKTLRPRLVIGFAAETKEVIANANAKREAKGCDWIIANDVSGGQGFDADTNSVTLITDRHTEIWKEQTKQAIAEKLVKKIIGVVGVE